MSDPLPIQLQEILSEHLVMRHPFRVHFEWVEGVLDIRLVATDLHCATCQCQRTVDVVMPKGPKGISRQCSWHHD